MKSFLSAVAAAIVVAVVSWLVLDAVGMSSADQYVSDSTRID